VNVDEAGSFVVLEGDPQGGQSWKELLSFLSSPNKCILPLFVRHEKVSIFSHVGG
jgi:hypothetical protein